MTARTLFCTALAISLAGIFGAQQTSQQHPVSNIAKKAPSTDTSNVPANVSNSYVDPAWCAQCHAEIANTYALTGMGRSFSKITIDTMKEQFPNGQAFFHDPSQSYFSIVEHDRNVFERRWQIGFNGKETNVEEKRIDYAVGSGNHAKTYLHLTARGTLEQLPMGWYSENDGTWAMIPGFDRADYPGSTRDVQYECMFCHNRYPKVPAANLEQGAESVYEQPLPLGIDCQRCHGPGQRHLDTVSKSGATSAEIRASIVNPARLGPRREMEVCMQCHLETTSLILPHSIERVSRAPFSYIAGQALGDFRLSFDREPGKNTRFEIAGAAYQLRKSQCFLQSQSKDSRHQLICTTCHDPHDIPRGEQATAHYNSVCGECHATQIKQKVFANSHPANGDCVSCHMPKVRTNDAIHVVMTDHFIQRRPPADLLAPRAEYYESSATSYKGKVIPYYPAQLATTEQNQLDVAAAQVRDGANLREGIPQLTALIEKYRPASAQYYVDLADALSDEGDATQSAATYQQAIHHAPSSMAILLKFGNAQIEWQQWANAESTLRRATAESPDDPVAWALLGQALFQEDKNAEAKKALLKTVALDPDLAEPHNYLGALFVRANDFAGAEREFREAIRLQPNHAEWQANLAGLLASQNQISEARYLFELSIRLDPNFAGAHLNYGRLLLFIGDSADAVEQLKIAARGDDPNVRAMATQLLNSPH